MTDLERVRANLKRLGVNLRVSESKCACRKCRDMCARPCFPSPEEARRIEAAFPGSLEEDATIKRRRNAVDLEYLRVMRPKQTQSGCIFFKNGKCELHYKGLKPIEGRIATHEGNTSESSAQRTAIAMLWM